MNQPPIDILRELHGAADRAGLACTRTGNFRVAMIDAAYLRAAAAEIERLRSVVEAWKTYSSRAERDIAGLREERDEARRIACEMEERVGCDESGYPKNGLAGDHAKRRGWDCFKEKA